MEPWVWALAGLQVLVCVGLIVAILLHSGKGAGLSDAFGGGLPNTFAGTSMIERNLDRITVGLTVVFMINSLVLMLALRQT